jgi:hypothetical protein
MDMKYKALIIAVVCLYTLVKAIKGHGSVSGLGVLSVGYLVYWGFQYFLTH